MQKQDCTQLDKKYNPQLLALMEKAYIKHYPVSLEDLDELSKKEKRRYWNIDYPLLNYIKRDGKLLRIIHLADPEAPKKTF